MPHEFRGHGFTDAKLRALPKLDRIRNIALWSTAVTDNGFRELLRAGALEEISISSDILSDSAFEVLAQLPALASVQVEHGPKIGDAGLRYLSKCTELTELYLKETSITDNGLKSISKLPQIWSLVLDDTKISDEGCAALADLKQLSLLSLNRTRVTGHGLAALRDSDFDIYLEGSPVTDQGVAAFAKELKKLKLISLSETGVGDMAARAIAKLRDVEDVRLSNTKITDDGLAAFEGHPTLDSLYVEGCAVSKRAVSSLKKATPNLFAVYGP
jgi:hypothetical protein